MFWTESLAFWTSYWRNMVALNETALASANVIARRSVIIKDAAHSPLDADVDELARMGLEKVVAFSHAGQSAMLDALKLQADWFAQMNGLALMASSGGKWRMRTLAGHGQRGARLATRTSQAAGRALAPVHRTVTANARRLS